MTSIAPGVDTLIMETLGYFGPLSIDAIARKTNLKRRIVVAAVAALAADELVESLDGATIKLSI